MTGSRTRLFASATTALGLISGGFDAHLAPQGDSFWHGLTASPGLPLAALSFGAALLVWALGRVADVRPFFWMGAGALPLVPAITGLGAPLLFFSNYTMSLVFAILLGFAARDLIPSLPRLTPVSAFLISFAFFVLVGRFLPGPAGPQGDEPHYLLIAESLIEDSDVDLKNQFDQRAFTKFTSALLEPHTAPRSPRERLYAIHTPGLSALIAPGYGVFGFAGAKAMVSLVMAAVVSLLFHASRSLFGDATASFVFLLSAFCSPIPIYANSLFPDSVATLPLAATLACMVSPRRALTAFATAAIAGLPWMHPRFLPLALLLALAIALRGGFSASRAALAFLPLLASTGLLLLRFQNWFGSLSVSAAYGPGFSSDVSVTRIPWGATGLVLDRQFGLLLFSPVILLGLAGASSLWKRDRMIAGLSAAAALMLLGVGGSFSMWWGGASAPARFLIGAMPALLLLCGAFWHDAPGRRGRLGAGSGFGLGLLFLACLAPRALHNRADGDSGLLRLLAPMLDTDRFFPGFVNPTDPLWVAGAWAVVLVAATTRPRGALGAAALGLAFAAVSSPRPFLDSFASSLRVLEAWDDRRQAFGGRDSESAFSLDVPLGAASWDMAPGAERYSARFSLPRGGWTLRVESRSETSPGALNVARVTLLGDDEGAAPFASVLIRADQATAVLAFALPQAERRLRVRVVGLQSRSSVLSIRLARDVPGR